MTLANKLLHIKTIARPALIYELVNGSRPKIDCYKLRENRKSSPKNVVIRLLVHANKTQVWEYLAVQIHEILELRHLVNYAPEDLRLLDKEVDLARYTNL